MKTSMLMLLLLSAIFVFVMGTVNVLPLSVVERQRLSGASADSIVLKSIPSPLYWVHYPEGFKVLSDDAVAITAAKGTDLYTFVDGSNYNNNAPKLLFEPDSNFIFSAKVKPAFNEIYDAGAIILYSDSSNWAKIIFEKFNETTWLIGSSVVADRRTDDSYHTNLETKEIWLKVAKSGKIFNFYHSFDGEKWLLTRTFHYDKVETLKVGFYSQSPMGTNCTVEFSNIRYKGIRFTDFYTGE